MKRDDILERAKHLKSMLDRAERSGTDCHTMDNIRHTLSMLIAMLETDCSSETAEAIVKRCENSATELFMKRYGPKPI